MGEERRTAPRAKVNLTARWEGILTQQEATITDLSSTGCFVLSGGKVEPRELIRVEIHFSNEGPIYFWAEVVDEAYEIGFAVRFTSSSDEDQARLDAYMEQILADKG